MKKTVNRSLILFILAILCISVLGKMILIPKGEWLTASANYIQSYQELSYQELDEYSNRTSVSNESPQITVFTHGLNGDASHWSNDGIVNNQTFQFSYNAESMLETLRDKIEEGGQEVVLLTASANAIDYWWDEVSKEFISSLSLEDSLSEPLNNASANLNSVGAKSLQGSYRSNNSLSSRDIKLRRHDSNVYNKLQAPSNCLTNDDVEKHIILVFEAVAPYASNDYVYAQFEYILDAISYQYTQITHELPTYNLIGHSRGGITNLQYALAHPYNVASLYSIGTPYNGSAFGSAELGEGVYPFLDIGVRKNFQYAGGVIDYAPGVFDILDSNLSNSYKEFWNTNQSLYNHIDFKPIGTYVTFGFVLQTLIDMISDDALETVLSDLSIAFEKCMATGNFVETASESLVENVVKNTASLLLDQAVDALIKYLGAGNPWLEILRNFEPLGQIQQEIAYGGDSHIGERYTFEYVLADDLFIDLKSQVADGYEMRTVKLRLMDSITHQATKHHKSMNQPSIAHNLETQDAVIVYYIVSDIDVGVGEIPMPNFLYRKVEGGYEIIDMTNEEFSGLVELPETYNDLPVVGIHSLVQNRTVGDKDETHHTNVTAITIPNSVTYISDYAFYGMSGLQSVALSSGLEKIAAKAFIGCLNLATLTLDSSNLHYEVVNNILYNEAQTSIIYYPAAKVGETYAALGNVTTVGDFAFHNSQNLHSIQLNQVTVVGEMALYECPALETVTATNARRVGISSFKKEFFIGIEAMVMVGDTLIQYIGNVPDLVASDFDGVKYIGPSAFAGNALLMRVTLPNTVLEVGANAFANCEYLQQVVIPESVICIEEGAFDQCARLAVIYYGGANETAWNAISIKELNEPLETSTKYYYLEGDPQEINHYWRFVNGTPTVVHCVTFIAHLDESTDPIIYGVVDGATIAKPTLYVSNPGYKLKYWALKGQIRQEYDWDTPVTEDMELIAVWELLPIAK